MIRRWVPLVMVIGLAAGMARGDDAGRYMPLSEVKVGMTGVCRTVLEGTKIDSIPVEVLGIMNDVRAGQSSILVRLKGPLVLKSGVTQGMSGSPVYVDGRIIGALAFGWPGSTDSLAGLTPIEDMLKMEEAKVAAGSGAKASATGDLKAAMISPGKDAREWFAASAGAGDEKTAGAKTMNRLALPLCVSGFTAEGMARLRESVPAGDWSVVQGGGGAGKWEGADVRLGPGTTVCVQLARGDLNAYGVGTVTDVVGDRVLAMGHPMTNEGRINLMMTTGYVHAVVPRRDISFKLASPGRPVGTMLMDQTVGVLGKLGKLPTMVPVRVTMRWTDGSAAREFNYEQTDEQKLMLSLVSAAMESCMTVKGMPEQEATVTMHTTVELEGYPAVETRNVFAGPKAIAESQGEIINPIGYIVNNPFEKPKFKRIEVEATIGKGPCRAAVAELTVPRKAYRPGETLQLVVTLMPVRSERTKMVMEMKLPKDIKPGSYSVAVCDADTEMQLDAGERAYRYEARSLADMVEILGRAGRRDHMVVRMSSVKQGVSVGERAFGTLPGSVQSVLEGQMRSDVGSFSEPLRVEKEVPYVLVGMQRTQVEILAPENENSEEGNE